MQTQWNVLREQLDAQEEWNSKREAENKKLQQQIDKRKQKLEESEKNAKRQTSRFPRRQRKTEPKKPGRKKGTPATHRDRPAKADREIDVPVGNCPGCCCAVETSKFTSSFKPICRRSRR